MPAVPTERQSSFGWVGGSVSGWWRYSADDDVIHPLVACCRCWDEAPAEYFNYNISVHGVALLVTSSIHGSNGMSVSKSFGDTANHIWGGERKRRPTIKQCSTSFTTTWAGDGLRVCRAIPSRAVPFPRSQPAIQVCPINFYDGPYWGKHISSCLINGHHLRSSSRAHTKGPRSSSRSHSSNHVFIVGSRRRSLRHK